MKNAHKLRNADDPFRKMSIKHDMTQDERQQDKTLREEAQIKTDTEENGNFIYVVKGIPWERHIVEIRVKRDQTERDQTPKEEACSQYKLQELKLRIADSNPSIIAISEVKPI